MSKRLRSGKHQPATVERSLLNQKGLDSHGLYEPGSIEVFGKLYDKYAPSLLGFIASMVSNNQIAEETLQHCFVEIWQRLKYYNASGEQLFVWMFKIARRSAIAVSEKNNVELKDPENNYFLNTRFQKIRGRQLEGEDNLSNTE